MFAPVQHSRHGGMPPRRVGVPQPLSTTAYGTLPAAESLVASRGTDGSNPSSSSGESGTNRTPSLRRRRSMHQLDRYRRDIGRLGRQRRYGFDCDVRGMIIPGSKAEAREDGNMRHSLTRIRTSHVGRLPPPKGWADMPARLAGADITDPVVIAAKVRPAIAETVKKQIEAGINCIGDGEFWTARNLAHYAAHFTGVEARPVAPDEPPTTRHSTRERDEFPDFYRDCERAGSLFLVPGETPMPPMTEAPSSMARGRSCSVQSSRARLLAHPRS